MKDQQDIGIHTKHNVISLLCSNRDDVAYSTLLSA